MTTPPEQVASLRELWQLDDDGAARLESLLTQISEILPADAFIEQATLPELAKVEAELEKGGKDPVADWITELEKPDTTEARKGLVLDALALFSERHGLHQGVVDFAKKQANAEDGDDLVRNGAMRALARARPAPLVAEWIKGLGDPDANVP